LTLGILSSNIGVAFWNKDIVYEGESIYNYLRVEENENSVILSTNVLFGVQSIKQKSAGLTGMYYDYALCAPVIQNVMSKDVSLLILGLGTGTYATQCHNYFGMENIDGVEIDEKIVDLANEYFDLPECVTTYIEDGRAYISRTDKKYEVIMVDAYQDITIPFQMSSVEFFTLVDEHLTDGGVMVVNMNMKSSGDGSINDYLCGTITSVFDNVYICPTNSANVVLFATNGDDLKERLENNLETIENKETYRFISRIADKFEKVEKNEYILTDDKAPVELLGMKVLDEMIGSELSYMKDAIKGKSLKEIFTMLINGEIV
jgi:spermidine synthase